MSEHAPQLDLNQLMALLNQQKQKQDALSQLANTQTVNQPIMQPGQNFGDFLQGKGNTPEQSRGLNAFYGSILNRDKTKQSFTGAASDGFEKGSELMDTIRTKQKAEKMLGAETDMNMGQEHLSNMSNLYGLKTNAENTAYSRATDKRDFEYKQQRDKVSDQLARELMQSRITAAEIKKKGGKPSDLEAAAPMRHTNLMKALKFREAFESGAESGTTRAVAGWIPGVYTDQGAFDQELNSFAEQAARAALKASGEIRPTDADVKGMKESMFGVGKDEAVNKNLLDAYIAEQLAVENQYRAEQGLPPLSMPSVENQGSDWYRKLFPQTGTDAPQYSPTATKWLEQARQTSTP